MAQPTFVQQGTIAQTTNVSQVSGTLNNVAQGDTVYFCFQAFVSSVGPKITSIQDDLGNNLLLSTSTPILTGTQTFIYVLQNATAGNRTITVKFAATTTLYGACILEYTPAIIATVGNYFFVASGATSGTSNPVSLFAGNQLVLAFASFHSGTATNAITPGSGFTARSSITNNAGGSSFMVEEISESAQGSYTANFTSTSAVTGGWTILIVALATAPPAPLTNGMVVLGTNGGAGSIISTSGGNGGTTSAALFDAYTGNANSNWTYWQNPNASGDYVGVDCGAPAQIDHVLLSWTYSQASFTPAGTAQLQASNDPAFGSPVTLFTFTNTTYPAANIVAGALLNSISLAPALGYYRYYRLTLPAANTSPADLAFYGNYYSGVNATCAPVQITNFNGTTGGNYDTPVRIRMACATTGVTIWYTTDGSTPSAGGGTSQQYTGPITITSTSVVQAIAVASGLSNSRVTLASYHIGQLLPMDIPYAVNRGGYRIWSVAGDKMWDPVSGLWYWCGINEDSMGVYEYAQEGIDIYSSPDLRNWSWAGFVNVNSNPQYNRVSMVYNAANNNYVMWMQQSLTSNMACFTAPNPAGPWTQSGSTITSMDNYSTHGDHKLFLDTDGSCYLIFDTNGGSLPDTNWYMSIHKLNATYTASSGTFVAYVNSGSGGGTGPNTTPFLQQSEGPAMAKIGSTYYFMASNLSPWTPAVNLVCTGTSPLGPWNPPINPFQADPTELTDGAAGYWGPGPLTPSQNYSYDSQTDGLIVIPGRQGINPGTPALMYIGDRWDFRNFGVIQTYTDSFQGWRHILLPVRILPNGNLQINWTNNWTFDSVFPMSGNLPAAASNLAIVTGATYSITWTNNQTGSAYALYLDRATDIYFTQNVVSEVLAPGTTSYTDNTVVAGTTYFYRVRTLTASGSVNFPVTPPVPPPPPPVIFFDGINPPFLPPKFSSTVPSTIPGGGWNPYTGPQEDGPSLYLAPYNGQKQTSKINQVWRP